MWFQFIMIKIPTNFTDLIFYSLNKDNRYPFVDKNQQKFFDTLFKQPILNILEYSDIKNIQDDQKKEFLENLVYKSMFALTYTSMKEMKIKEKNQTDEAIIKEYKKSYKLRKKEADQGKIVLEDLINENHPESVIKNFFDYKPDNEEDNKNDSERRKFLSKYWDSELYRNYTYKEFLIGYALQEILSIYRSYILCKNGDPTELEKIILDCMHIEDIYKNLNIDLTKRENAKKSEKTKKQIKNELRNQYKIIRDNNDIMSREQYIKELTQWYKKQHNKTLKRESDAWWDDFVLY